MIIPTRNEAHNVEPLVARLSAAFGCGQVQVLFVDDSDDETPVVISKVASRAVVPVRLIHREPGERGGGLGAAVLAGLRDAADRGAEWAVVMDGDLQHPPEVAPALLAEAVRTEADLAVASRYIGNGTAEGLSDRARVVVSRSATSLSKAVFPRKLRQCSDPMSGFFAIRLASVDLDRLRPQGFKILLEIVARSKRLRIAEQPFTFAERHSGNSKASWREGVVFLHRLSGLRLATILGRHSARAATVVGFAAVGASGLLVNSVALWFFVAGLGVGLLWAAVLATEVSTIWNFALTDGLVFRGHKARPWWQRFVGFALVNNAVLLLRLPLLYWLIRSLGVHYIAANVMTLLAAFALRFLVADLYLFSSRRDMSITSRRQGVTPTDHRPVSIEESSAPCRSGPTDLVVDLRDHGLPSVRVTRSAPVWHYDIHGLVTLSSVVQLRELEHFATDHDGPCDIEIRGGDFGNRQARTRARVTQYAAIPAVSYEEHSGRRGADFLVDMTENICVTVGPMLLTSPHVLYTNVVEALLRFVLVSRDRVLLHSACLELDGMGVLLSARTDTGKTGTVLRLVRESRARFLSDDMTILSADGAALCFPKPLTISQHTLRAVDAGELTPSEWRWLRVQSRLHSKGGRGIGARLGELNVPIMSLNALTQHMVPPPKYVIQRLVRCEESTSVSVKDLFIIERQSYGLEDVDPDTLIDELIDNTDDAYGFPPFRYFAPALVIDGQGYDQLRVRERAILTQAVSGVRARRLATPDFTWADHIPSLIGATDTDRVVDGTE
ncbi:GtrA family protein [Leekyejoonella antrihumi]|uniref:GtrA family protein n=1 Tax=Leekyejoonella antrihumi TaxID=1660198 RepID=UPI001646692C|nr:GtrA family protein [Leekyejoonella antrihumi]